MAIGWVVAQHLIWSQQVWDRAGDEHWVWSSDSVQIVDGEYNVIARQHELPA